LTLEIRGLDNKFPGLDDKQLTSRT